MKVTEFLQTDRFFSILNNRVKESPWFDKEIESSLIEYLDDYLVYSEITTEDLSKAYLKYIKSYNKDMKTYLKTCRYPLQLGEPNYIPTRTEYSLILLFSIIASPHRMRIMSIINTIDSSVDSSILLIGCGPGYEINLIQKKSKNIIAYDLELDGFLEQNFKDLEFRNDYFDGSDNEIFDDIYLIELLEHLEDPYALLKNCHKVLEIGGDIHLTTATNMPQFDHLYNFEISHADFEEQILNLGFEIVFKEIIKHKYIVSEIESQNCFYTIKKIK